MWRITMLVPGPNTETGPGQWLIRTGGTGLPGGSETVLKKSQSVEQLTRLIRRIEAQDMN